MGQLRSIVKTRCSLVVCCIDAFSGRPPISSGIIVSIDGCSRQPIRKKDGITVFTDLRQEPCIVKVSSPFYTTQSFTVSLDKLEPNDPIVHLPLSPGLNYPFSNHVTRIHGRITNHAQIPLPHVLLTATPLSSVTAIARVTQEKVEAGADGFQVGASTETLLLGNFYRLYSKTEQHEEIFRVEKLQHDNRFTRLQQPLSFSYQRGDLLFPVIQTVSDHKGEFILAFRQEWSETVPIRLTVSLDAKEWTRDWDVQPGQWNRLGDWQL